MMVNALIQFDSFAEFGLLLFEIQQRCLHICRCAHRNPSVQYQCLCHQRALAKRRSALCRVNFSIVGLMLLDRNRGLASHLSCGCLFVSLLSCRCNDSPMFVFPIQVLRLWFIHSIAVGNCAHSHITLLEEMMLGTAQLMTPFLPLAMRFIILVSI